MAKTKLSDLGSSVCVDKYGEKFVPALGNNAAIPGDLVWIDPSTGRVDRTDKTDHKFFTGILMESVITGTETAIATDTPCKVVVPKSGHGYRIRVTIVAAAADEIGGGATFEDDEGKAETTNITLALSKLARLSAEAAVGDTVAEVIWIE